MTQSREALIAQLAAHATPIEHPGRTTWKAMLWLMLATAMTLAALMIHAPLASPRLPALIAVPRFFIETLLGIAAILALSTTAFRLSIPAATSLSRLLTLPLMLLLAWVGMYVFGLIDPALAPSMAGKRVHCWLEALLAGVPGLVLGCIAVRRLWPLRGAWTGAFLGLASGALPALAMQLVCMYEPAHILKLHLAPGLALGVVGAVVGRFVLKPRSAPRIVSRT
jgi:hypothetical protein